VLLFALLFEAVGFFFLLVHVLLGAGAFVVGIAVGAASVELGLVSVGGDDVRVETHSRLRHRTLHYRKLHLTRLERALLARGNKTIAKASKTMSENGLPQPFKLGRNLVFVLHSLCHSLLVHESEPI
jgi:hypothetical protein